MILSAQSIRSRRLYTNRGDVIPRHIFEPFHERTVRNGMSFGLSCASYDVRVAETLTLHPGVFVLASTIEHFHLPNDVVGTVHDKSTWARRGIALQNTLIDPGFRGILTLEITNHSSEVQYIAAGDPVAQIKLEQLDQATEQPYCGKYQDQAPGPQPARLERAA